MYELRGALSDVNMSVLGKIRSPQAATKMMAEMTRAVLRTRGRAMRIRYRNDPAPSIDAASSTSAGMPEKAGRSSKIAKGIMTDVWANETPVSVFRSPS